MKTFYCVTTSYNDHGNVISNITASRDCEECPESSFTSTSRRDIYNDWYDDYTAAVNAVNETRSISSDTSAARILMRDFLNV